MGKEVVEKKRNGEDYESTGQGVRLVLEPEERQAKMIQLGLIIVL